MNRFLAALVGLLFTSLALLPLGGCRPAPVPVPAPEAPTPTASSDSPSAEYVRWTIVGKNHYDQGEASNALAAFRTAAELAPGDADAHFNLAIATLLAGQPDDTIRHASEFVRLTPQSAAGHFVLGSACLRLGRGEDAVKALENAKRIDQGEASTFFQLGRARTLLQQWDEAIRAFREGLDVDPNHLHAPAHFLLGQALLRAGRTEEARKELDLHQVGLATQGPVREDVFERCKHTRARVPFTLEQPTAEGIPVRFDDATAHIVGEAARRYGGPIGVVDAERSGWNGLLVVEDGERFRWLQNEGGVLRPAEGLVTASREGGYRVALVGDLDNDRTDEAVVLGTGASHLLRFETNGILTDVTRSNLVGSIRATDGMLVDLDFTGRLDLVTLDSPGGVLRLRRQAGALRFEDATRGSGFPDAPAGFRSIELEDWDRDGNADLIVGRDGAVPTLLVKRRGGPVTPTELVGRESGGVMCTGDFDNDLRPDLAIHDGTRVVIRYQNGRHAELSVPGASSGTFQRLVAHDYDNDGWLDLWGVGSGIQVWRNRGTAGFTNTTSALGLDGWGAVEVVALRFADLDRDCDSDLIVTTREGGLRVFLNEGGNAHRQIQVQLVGNRSNASGIGSRVEIETAGLRLDRMVRQLPMEVGVGARGTVDSLLVHWFNWPQGAAGVGTGCETPFLAVEAFLQEGSCPYLYAWDGTRFRFVTDILGAAPLGLPLGRGRYVEADPEEWVWIGTDETFGPIDGRHVVQITEELREVLYLDQVKLAVVDHDPSIEVHPTDKLRPGGPYAPDRLVALHRERRLVRATDSDGGIVTALLQAVDGQRASPPRLRPPQLRGLAHPHAWILDFGPLDSGRPWVLVLNGWLKFGGGMANIAASLDPDLPFPFPVLDAEVGGAWKRVDVTVGAPAGKTKTILVDLEGRLGPGTHRLRLTGSLEIHWDRIALMEKAPVSAVTPVWPNLSTANLAFRGFSALEPLPADWPGTPDHRRAHANSVWTIIPEGWSTRYGDVLELVSARDEGLAIVHSGDALTLAFDAESLPAKPPGKTREFFLFVDGWDKDSDFHVAEGTRIEPLPFHGMDDQRYGQQERPPFPSDALHRRYNTRWVDGRALKQTVSRRSPSNPLPSDSAWR